MLEIKGLSKKFKNNEKYSLKNISFQVDQGEIVGLIGKNGAGKTTLMKLIAKAIRPTDGNILINQKSILKSPNSLNDFGFMIEGSLFNHLNAIEHLKFFISLNGKVDHRENIEYVLRLVDLWEKRHINPSNFSFGMKQRLSLAICLVTEPKILILDEPFVGLDPNGVEKLIETLKQWVQKKDTAIIISSHQLSELEEICNRFLFIDNGELKEDFVLDQKDTTIIELNKSFVFTTEYKEKYRKFITLTTKSNMIEVSNNKEVLNDLLSDLMKEYRILNLKDKKDYIQQKFKGENR
ncbi:ABC transporter ATP-binding protein [Staphylococcus xylosus]|nr:MULTISPECIES: ABC transporter ATP-binding protein [Staphylococcus]PTI75365.1 ABC transporter ATP-binding protein [Staphylococcus succinus]PTE80368.1 ABC transporter ATP-binding protein [Staphylococcus equorum]PTI74286.1 ABC transporter ATP-binding protein [Staphylococcus xylosus]PTJ65234.1 ABC transporter ATP-binding protein [Staphylococcus saprophyticus]RIM85612.1 ABC transporter ATP-binding protein [Staphylococcus xylosus]